MTPDSLIETLESIALLLELKGENLFKTRAYKNGARGIQMKTLATNRRTANQTLRDSLGLLRLGLGKAFFK